MLSVLKQVVSDKLDVVSDTLIMEMLDQCEELLNVYINTSDNITVMETKIVACIQEYLFHFINEIGGITFLHNVDKVIFAGSYFTDPIRSVLNVIKTNVSNNDWYWIEFSYGWD